jgi:hypothetical protein
VAVQGADPDSGVGGDLRHGHCKPVAVDRRDGGASQLLAIAVGITAQVLSS